jgi:hypothetical protein
MRCVRVCVCVCVSALYVIMYVCPGQLWCKDATSNASMIPRLRNIIHQEREKHVDMTSITLESLMDLPNSNRPFTKSQPPNPNFHQIAYRRHGFDINGVVVVLGRLYFLRQDKTRRDPTHGLHRKMSDFAVRAATNERCVGAPLVVVPLFLGCAGLLEQVWNQLWDAR